MNGIVIASDLHAHNWPRFATTLPDGRNSRFADLLGVLDQIERVIERTDPEAVVLLGDLTHRRFQVHFSIYTPLVQWIARIAQARTVYCLVGNHDIEARGYHSLGPLALVPGVVVIDTPTLIDFKTLGTAYMVPYLEGDGVAEAFRRDVKTDLAFTHYALDGHVLGTEHEYALPSSLRYDDVAPFWRVFFGHVHAPSVEHDGQVTYVGAPLHFDFGDTGDRYVWHATTEASNSIKLLAPKFVTTRYPRVGIPNEPGFLRVLDTPADQYHAIQEHARDLGWLGVEATTAKIPDEAIRVLSAGVFADEQLILDWVERKYGDSLDQETRTALTDVGLGYLRAASGV